MSFTKEVWMEIEPIYNEIIQHPFNRELADGTLATEKFQYYMKQDSLYLVEFARCLALAASKAETADDLVLLLDFSRGAIVAERDLHEYYFGLFNITLDVEPSPGCAAYTSFLLAKATHGSYPEAIGALLPCFWIYREVGMHIHQQSAPDNPFQKWIDTYSGKDFHDIVEQAIDLTDRVAQDAGPQDLTRMHEAFIKSTRLEWMFWDSAYNIETWKP